MHLFTRISKTFLGNELLNTWHRFKHGVSIDLSQTDLDHLSNLKNRGWTVLSSEFTSTELDETREALDLVFSRTDLPIWSDDEGADFRLFGMNNLSDIAKRFCENENARRILTAYTKIPITDITTMGGRIQALETNKGSGGGWHRDTAEFKQVKSIMYASPITETNGPFQYVDGSHKRKDVSKISSFLGHHWNERRFANSEIENLCEHYHMTISTLIAGPGEIILVDTSGLHRGKPLDSGSRYALTNYIWNNRDVPDHIKKMIYSP
ncbi:phytanoyl-CoA dioxygenase family protein [bacterium]|nr:phytanoyl-CoA dioxygenase family protein [bacterium]MDC1212023.1 phytanoyl-CoA dioxygenase family protein [bacterium]